MFCLFALMLLSPVAASASVADGLDANRDLIAQATEAPEGDLQEEPTEEPFVEPTEEVTEEPFVEPTEEPFVEPTEEATEEPEGEQLGAIEIEYRECDPGYDVPGADPGTVLMECDRVDDVLFEIVPSDGVPSSQLTGEFGDSHVSFTELPTGPTTIRQIDAPGDIYVTCNGIVQNGGPETGEMPLTVNANDDSVQWTLLDDEIAFCTWFAVTEGEQVGAIEIEYRECEAGYILLDGTDEDDLDQMLMDCSQVDGVEFTIDEGGPDGDTQLTGEFGDSHVSFTEVPAGLRTVTQTTAFDTTYVVCNGIVQNGGPETGVMEVPIADGAIEWNLLDEEVAFCNWFVIAGAADATEMPGTETATEPTGTETATEPTDTGTPESEQVGSININYWECPATYDLATADPTALETDCTETTNGIPFQVSNAGGVIETQETGDINDGVVAFAEVPTGIVTISQLNAPAVPRVSCEGIVSNGGPETGIMELSAPSGAAEWDLLDDEVVYCDWYTVPMGEPGDLTIYKWTCPEGYDVHGANANPPMDCTQATDGVTFVLSDGDPNTADLQSDTGDSIPGAVRFDSLQPGNYTVTETLPEGIGSAFVWNCNFLVLTFGGEMPISEGSTFNLPFNGGSLRCDWFNVPGTDNTVTIIKWYCPKGVSYDEEQTYYEQTCTQYHEGVDFKLTHGEGSVFDTTDANGKAEWTAVPLGPFSIQEYIPPQYGEPVVFCVLTAPGGGMIALQRVEAPNGYVESEIELPNTSYFCHWFNVPGEPGEITIYKYTCPEGYDLHAWGANPKDDCPDVTNGINFTLVDDDPGTVDLQSMTGDAIEGAVRFGGLDPGPYTVIETVPPGTQYVFTLDCYGQNMGELRPYPLQMGDTLDIHLSAGESIECYWYNVPRYDPDYGRLTVYKYDCGTATYESDVDCETHEGGKAFDLVYWDGDSWEYADTKTTDGAGKIMWVNVDPGEYWLDEHDGDWCRIASKQMSDDGNWINVYEDQETVVTVYNCGTKPPGTPDKTPTKYPDTGVGSEGPPDAPTELPALAPLAGLLALLATRRTRTVADAVTCDPSHVGAAPVAARVTRRSPETKRADTRVGPYQARPTPEDPMNRTLSRRKLAALLTLPLGGTALVRSGLLAQGDRVIEPLDGTPPGGTPASLCLPATPEAEADPDACLRGPVPVTLVIESIGVEAPVEILETVGGVMQQPSDEVHVAWYKESARLGEVGNIHLAGHLNWWGHPEAVFFALGTLREGDSVVLFDEEETAFRYEVEWVRQESNLEPPAEEVLGMTAYEAVTLLTCSGEWDSSISEYDERTVVRAKRVIDEGTPEA